MIEVDSTLIIISLLPILFIVGYILRFGTMINVNERIVLAAVALVLTALVVGSVRLGGNEVVVELNGELACRVMVATALLVLSILILVISYKMGCIYMVISPVLFLIFTGVLTYVIPNLGIQFRNFIQSFI